MNSYRFLDAMGDVVDEGDFGDHAAALVWAKNGHHDEVLQRVEHLGRRATSHVLVARATPSDHLV